MAYKHKHNPKRKMMIDFHKDENPIKKVKTKQDLDRFMNPWVYEGGD